jgi:hypothetical protein
MCKIAFVGFMNRDRDAFGRVVEPPIRFDKGHDPVTIRRLFVSTVLVVLQ